MASATPLYSETTFHALLIGNDAYEVERLRNPTNDVELLGSALRRLGFEVTIHKDLGHYKMDEALSDFTRNVPEGGLALVYYAGHGIGVGDNLYLVPTDARLHNSSALKYQTVSQDYVLDMLNGSKANTKVLMMDCCRNNPFERSWPIKLRTHSSQWTPRTEAPEGTLIAYATEENQTALDGAGDNSPFALHLSRQLGQRPPGGLFLLDAIRDASNEIKNQTGQRAWVHFDSSMPKICLSPKTASQSKKTKPQANVSALVSKEEPARPKPSIDTLPSQSALLDQARLYLEHGDLDLAIDAFSIVALSSDATQADRTAALRDRSAAYIRRAENNDFERALIDAKAIGESGIQLPLLANSAAMRIERETTGRIHRNQIATVISAKGDLFYVDSIYGGRDLHGWVKKDAFMAKSEIDIAPQKVTQPSKSKKTVTTTEEHIQSTSLSPVNPTPPVSTTIPATWPANNSSVVSPASPEVTRPTSHVSPGYVVEGHTPSYTPSHSGSLPATPGYSPQNRTQTISAQPRYQLAPISRGSSGRFQWSNTNSGGLSSGRNSFSGGMSGRRKGGGCPGCKLGRR
ncbi:peptidase C14, caspase catalytic subunit p20 [Rhodopirellula sallentina SM41]|uniref:Peptidase C14, caspase catalytic subunit p20 n=1 Tax=Rhodopirellula sallentina SM41 TaxID=1263870 RepID=M5U3H3_9BACT|nr:peptidase C14, caspase catalytic subunit p20 [Rhodopirellula sallentina SM41]